MPKISEESQHICDKSINFDEVCKAVDALANNKLPGIDGIPVECYKNFGMKYENMYMTVSSKHLTRVNSLTTSVNE